ncbi:MAG: hypothetical protein PF795_15280 [Kiritimatiellae bacterium]|nr:hypothetical protein [Kiritimatiellia bacterium]
MNRLPNPRMVYDPGEDGRSLDELILDTDERAAEAISGRVKIRGAFNVNSTSKRAWKAVLASMLLNELPVLNPQTGEMSWEQPEQIRFNRFSHVLSSESYASASEDDAAFWQGWREVTPDQLDELAEEIVTEVKARGPFRSLAEFVNRDPDSPVTEHRRKGALQAALDRTLNRQGTDIPEQLGGRAQKPVGSHFSDAIADESEAAGAPGYLMQGDILQTLAPVLQARSDTFRIRAFAQVAPDGNAQSPIICEAVVQRIPEYIDPQNEAHENEREDILSPVNQRFGRRFRIVSFRWLDPAEI